MPLMWRIRLICVLAVICAAQMRVVAVTCTHLDMSCEPLMRLWAGSQQMCKLCGMYHASIMMCSKRVAHTLYATSEIMF